MKVKGWSNNKLTTNCSPCPSSRKQRRKNTVTTIRGLGQKCKADKLPYKEEVNLLNILLFSRSRYPPSKTKTASANEEYSLSVNRTKQFLSNRVFKCSYCLICPQTEFKSTWKLKWLDLINLFSWRCGQEKKSGIFYFTRAQRTTRFRREWRPCKHAQDFWSYT